MKKLLALSILMIFTLTGFSQESYSDLIYLKNGSIIKAKITDQKPGASISYKSENEITTTIQWDEIEKYYIDNKMTLVKPKDSKARSTDSITSHKELQSLKKQDYIYFRNFDILRGEIIEEHPQDYLKLKHNSFNSLTIPYDYIRRIRYTPQKGIKSKKFTNKETEFINHPSSVSNDKIILNNGDTIRGVIFQLIYPEFTRILVDEKYRETYQFSEISYININQKPKQSKAKIYFGNREKLSGNICELKPDSIIMLKPLILNDTLIINEEDVDILIFSKTQQTMQQRLYFNGDHHYFSIAAGFGNSYGYMGFRAQYRAGGVFGIAPHAGVGIYPDIMGQEFGPWFNIGLKVVGFNWFYMDLSYGVVNRTYKKVPPYLNGDEIAIDETATSLLCGVDFFINEYIGMNLAFGKVIDSSDNKLSDKLVYDTGFIIKIPIWKTNPNNKNLALPN